MNLDESRKTIDEIDRNLIGLLNARARASRGIAELKVSANLPIADEMREAEILRKVMSESNGIIADDSIEEIYRIILRESRRIQAEAKSRLRVEEATA